MQNILFIALGGVIGALCRYGVTVTSALITATNFPLGTFVVNMVGSFAIGFLWVTISPSNMPTHLKNMIFIGVLGSFTTFSSYTLESLKLMQSGDFLMATSYIIGSNLIGLLMVFLGYSLAKAL